VRAGSINGVGDDDLEIEGHTMSLKGRADMRSTDSGL
jgi:hypothetical protein